MILRPGDTVLTRGKSWVSASIRFFTRGIGEPRTKVNHVGIVTEGGPIETALITEAVRKVTKRPLWATYAPQGDSVAIYRRRHLPIEDRRMIARKADSYVGRSYGYLKIAAHVVDYFLLGAFVARRLCRMENYPMCAWHWGAAFAAAGIKIAPVEELSPDHIWDHVNGHPDEWELVRPLEPLLPKEH